LSWEEIPGGTESFALVSDDPDAPGRTWVHWLIYDIPAETNSLPSGIPRHEHPAAGGTQGVNDFRKIGYGGPCPPEGTHRYFFKLYALDSMLNLKPGATKKELLTAMDGHILEECSLMGIYFR
jgi:hypothetical protein